MSINLRQSTRLAERALLTLAALLPVLGMIYLRWSGAGELVYMDHGFHEFAIAVSLFASTFIAFVAMRCYQASGEVFVGWLTLALIGETLVYLPHGAFTRLSHDHMALFLIYGPASRLVMAGFLLVGLLHYDRKARTKVEIGKLKIWRWIALFVAIDAVLAWASLRHTDAMPWLRLLFEYAALAMTFAAMAIMLLRPKASPLMHVYTFSMAGFATSSITFVLSAPWTHLWWYAHGVFAAAFLLLGYGVLQAFHATGSFSGVFSQRQMMERLRAAKLAAELAAHELRDANAKLKVLATMDSLTGVANRRHFLDLAQSEADRCQRNGTRFSILLIDLDHFKNINDRFGHASGDLVLQGFVSVLKSTLRRIDTIGRLGGEEFAVLLPGTDTQKACEVGERFNALLRELVIPSLDQQPMQISASSGIATFGIDGDSVARVLQLADQRMYEAKRSGRDRVVGSDPGVMIPTRASL